MVIIPPSSFCRRSAMRALPDVRSRAHETGMTETRGRAATPCAARRLCDRRDTRPAPASHTCTLGAGRAFFTAAPKNSGIGKRKKTGAGLAARHKTRKKKTARKNGRSFGNVPYLRAQRSVQALSCRHHYRVRVVTPPSSEVCAGKSSITMTKIGKS